MKERKISTKQVGDGKLPNKYWVSICNDYYYFNKENDVWDWIGDLDLFESEGKTIKAFTTFKGALNWIEENLYLGMDYDGIKINTITIEDRLSGEVYSHIRHFNPEDGSISDDSPYTDTKFTSDEMKKRGVEFK